MAVVTDYLRRVLEPVSFKKTLKALVKRLDKYKDDFDTIVFRGMSGALIGPALAVEMNKQMLLIRKDKQCHSAYLCEGNHDLEKYIVVDDLVCTGDTMRAINKEVQAIGRDVGTTPQFRGLITYIDSSDQYKKTSDLYFKLQIIFGVEDFFLETTTWDVR